MSPDPAREHRIFMLEEVLKKERSDFKIAGNYKMFTTFDPGICIETEDSKFDIIFYSPASVRVHQYGLFQDTNPYSVIRSPSEKILFDVEEEELFINIFSEMLDIQIKKEPLTITFLTKDGRVINEGDQSFGTIRQGEQTTVYKKLQKSERFVGLGEKTGPLDRKGCGYQNWNTDHFAYDIDTDPIYASIPFYIGIHSGLSYGIYVDNSYKSHFNFGASNNRFSSFSTDSGDMDYYFFYGSVPQIIYEYTSLTGRIQLPPLWSIGYQQCRYSYYPEGEVLNIARKFREKDIPADVVVLDIHHMDEYKIFTWDSKRFPNPLRMTDKLKEMGFETTVICDPGIKIEEKHEPYQTGLEEDVFVKYPDASYYEGEVWPGWCHFPDFTKKEARAWWRRNLKSYTDVGIKGFWNDMNEIATWGQMLPENMLFSMENEGGTTRKARNIYGFQMSRASFEGARDLLDGERPFILTRAGFAGVQRYSALWTGDNVAKDDHMMAGVRLVNSLGLSGVPFAGYDIGGFAENGDGRLFARWIQLGVFSPFFRSHSNINSRDSEPWSYGERVEDISANYIRLRYQLLPYLYQAFLKAHEIGIPIAKSLTFDYTHDENIYKVEFENQYLFGDSILVAPIRSDQQFVKVYLPEGRWYEFFTDAKIEGGVEMVREYDLEHLPLFVRAPAVIPVYPEIGSNTKETGKVLALHIYNGTHGSSIQYYEDDGISYDFEKGNYHRRTITFDPERKLLTAEKAAGNYQSKIQRLRVVLHGFDEADISAKFNEKFSSFIQPIADFDPLTKTRPHELRSRTFEFETEYSMKRMAITW